MRNEEYEAFGPWIDEVVDERGVPRLFRKHPIDLAAARLVLKVPRNIDRRDATPSMNLYDALIVVSPSTLTVLNRVDDDFVVTESPLSQVLAIEDTVLLLEGRLRILLVDGPPVVVDYNGSARGSVIRLVSLLRELCVDAGATASSAPPSQAQSPSVAGRAEDDVRALLGGPLDRGLLSECIDAIRSGDLRRVVAGHPTRPLSSPSGVAAGLGHAFRPARLQGGVLLEGAGFLVHLHRRDAIARGRGADLSQAATTLFPARLTRFSRAPHERYDGVDAIAAGAGDAEVRILVPRESTIDESDLRSRVRG